MFFIVLISLIIYIIAGAMIYHNVYNLDNDKKIKLIIFGVLASLILTVIITNISVAGQKLELQKELSITKTTTILLFSPINLIVSIPYIGHVLNDYEINKISKEKLNKKMLIFIVVLLCVLALEISYAKEFQLGIIQNMMRLR